MNMVWERGKVKRGEAKADEEGRRNKDKFR